MLPPSLLFRAVAITDPSGSKTTAPTVPSLTSTPRSLCAGLKPSGIVAICIELHAGMSLLRVIGSLTHRDTMLPAFTPYILSCDDMFIIDATNEAGDTESRSDIKDSDIAYRIRPPAFVEVHPCCRKGVIVDLRLHQAERPLVVCGRIDDAYGRVSRNRIEFLSELQHSLRVYAGFRACAFHCPEQRSGYGMLFSGNICQRSDHPVSIIAIRFVCDVNSATCINTNICNEICILRSNEASSQHERFRKPREQLNCVPVAR